MESYRAGSALRIHELFQQNSFRTAKQIVMMTGFPPQSSMRNLLIWSVWASLTR